MPHMTIGGWEYRDGHASAGLMAENKHAFAYLRAKMRCGMNEAQAQVEYDTEFPGPRTGQQNCGTCGKWDCDELHV